MMMMMIYLRFNVKIPNDFQLFCFFSSENTHDTLNMLVGHRVDLHFIQHHKNPCGTRLKNLARGKFEWVMSLHAAREKWCVHSFTQSQLATTIFTPKKQKDHHSRTHSIHFFCAKVFVNWSFRIEQNKTKQNKTKQNKTKQNTTKTNESICCYGSKSSHQRGRLLSLELANYTLHFQHLHNLHEASHSLPCYPHRHAL